MERKFSKSAKTSNVAKIVGESKISKEKDFKLTIDTDVETLSALSASTIQEMCKTSKYPNLMSSMMSDIKKSRMVVEAHVGRHIYWSWSSH